MAKVGRPKGTNNKNITVSMRMDKQTKERLEKYCEKMHVVKSEALRQAITLLTKDMEDQNQAFDENSSKAFVFCIPMLQFTC